MFDFTHFEIVQILNGKKKSIFYTDEYSEKSYFKLYEEMSYIMYEQMLANTQDNSRKLRFGYLESKDEVSGTAFMCRDNDCVFINCGTILKIHDVFNKLMCNPQVFSSIGTPRYSDFRVHNNPELNYKGEFQTVFFNGPEDTIRRDLAFLLSYFAVRYIILHEIGHHLNGHIFLINEDEDKKWLSFEMSEGGEALIKLSRLDYQTLEMDADSFATSASIIHLQSLYETLDSFPFQSLVPNLSMQTLLKYWLFSIHCLHRLLGKDKITEENIMEAKYLPVRVRQALPYQIPEIVFEKLSVQFNNGEYKKIIDEMLPYSENMYNLTFDTETDLTDLLIKSPDLVGKHTKLVHDNWKNIKPKLIKYARAILAE